MEVVEDVLLRAEHAGTVPGLAVLAAAAQIRDREYAAGLDPRRPQGAEGGRERVVETAVAVQDRRPGAVRFGSAGEDRQLNLRAVLGRVVHAPHLHRRRLDRARRRGPARDRAGACVEHERVPGRGEVRVFEPGARPSLRVLDEAGHRAPAGRRDFGDELAGREVVEAQLAAGVAGAKSQQQRSLESLAVEDRVVLEYRRRIFGHEIAPLLVGERFGIGHAQPEVAGVAVRQKVETPVAADVRPGVRVDAFLHGDEIRAFGRTRREIGDVDVVAGRGAAIGGDDQPTAVVRNGGAVVVRLLQPVAEHHHVL